jgi:hypothetical protein
LTPDELYSEYPDIKKLLQRVPGVKIQLPKSFVLGGGTEATPIMADSGEPAALPQGGPPGLDGGSSAAAPPQEPGAEPIVDPTKPKAPGEDDDSKVEAELSRYFDVNIEDILPKEIVDELTRQATQGMALHDAIGIAGIAITNPRLAGDLLLDMQHRKQVATSTLATVGMQLGTFKREGARQLAMYMRARKDQRFAQEHQDTAASSKEYLERSKQSAAFLDQLRKSGLDPGVVGVPPISEEVLRDPVKFGDWVQEATTAASKGSGKQEFLAEISGMKANGPATLAAKTGSDPTAAVESLAAMHGFTPEEIAGLRPTIDTFAKVAQTAQSGLDQKRLKDAASAQWMQSLSDKNAAEVAKITAEVEGNPGMKRDKAISLMNSTMMLQMTAQTEFTNVQQMLALEMQKRTPEDAAAVAGGIPWNDIDPGKVQDPAKIESLQRRMESASMIIAEAGQALAGLYPIAQGTGAGDVGAMLMDIGPKLAEAARLATLGGKIKPPGVPPPMIAEAMAAAATPATWLAYLKQPPIGPDGQPNPYRTAYWASVVRQMGASLGGLQDPEDIIRLLDAQSAGKPSYADMFAGRDITLPEQPISAMASSLQGGGAPPPPASPAGAEQQKPKP